MTTARIVIGHTDCTDAIKTIAAAAPPLTPTQVNRLRAIFAPAVVGLASSATTERCAADARPIRKRMAGRDAA
jgi:hypothetical protein